MKLSRRDLVWAGLLSAGGLHRLRPAMAQAATIEIGMRGTATGSGVWFDPVGVLVQVGDSVRWTNEDRGNSHTATAYHPDNGKPLRIPQGAATWDSGYLMPGESFTHVFETEGVYDYLCLPHELAGMVGRIIVARPERDTDPAQDEGLPEAARRGFPAIEDILRRGSVSGRADGTGRHRDDTADHGGHGPD